MTTRQAAATRDFVTLARQRAVIPVLTIDNVSLGVQLARALVAGGLDILEITLRTRQALDAIRAITAEVPGAIVGAGTLIEPRQFDEATRAGASFLISPGASQALFAAAKASDTPWLPAVATVSETIAAREAGFRALKFFPAEISGGTRWLQAVSPLFDDVVFCPTGGVQPGNAGAYLALKNVFVVGGSWLAPSDALIRGDFAAITALAKTARAWGASSR